MSVWPEFTSTLLAMIEEQQAQARENDLDLRVTVRSTADADWDDNSWPSERNR